MKQRTLGLLIAVLTATIFAVSSSDLLTETTSAQKRNNRAKTVKTILPKSKRIKKIIKGSEKPSEIPDNVAYELFLRTVATGNARGLVKRIGLDDEAVEIIMREAYSLNENLEHFDRRAFELKTSKGSSENARLGSDLSNLQTKKQEIVERSINRFLAESLRDEKMNKLQNFVRTEVKRNVQKILVNENPKSGEVALSKYFANSFAKKAFDGSGELYLYSDAWNDGINVYGSGSITEQYTSDTSYRVTISVTSPGGRSNTTAGDWSYATVINDAGLSTELESGTYSVLVNFEEQSGYYDEYGNFYGTGSSFVGSSNASSLVRPLVSITAVNPATYTFPETILSRTFTANIGLSADIGNLTLPLLITVEFNEQSNNGGVGYQVRPNAGVNPPTGRVITINHNSPGGTVGAGFNIERTLSENYGTVVNQFRISRVSRIVNGQPQELNPATDFEYGTRVMNTSFTVPSPTPSPTPPSGGTGCRSGFAASGEKYSEEKDSGGEEGNRCSPCNPDPQELYACTTQFQGTYDWNFCFCGQSPIVLDILGNGFNLTNPQNGVLFDITADAVKEQMAWTSPDTDDAWLALDRNQNNQIDDGKELFGNISEQPAGQNPRQGFASLGMFDQSSRGGNGDGQITRRDAVFRKLRLWRDRNQNGVSEPEELFRLHALDVVAIGLDYRESIRRDEHGNKFKYRAKVRDRANANVGRWAWDVFLRVQP